MALHLKDVEIRIILLLSSQLLASAVKGSNLPQFSTSQMWNQFSLLKCQTFPIFYSHAKETEIEPEIKHKTGQRP